MIKTIINAFKLPDIRKKLLFTAFIILIFRIGSVIPVPFLNITEEISVGKGNTILTYLSLMTGSAFTYGTIFAMSITPYINSSIIMQLLAVAIPALENLQKRARRVRRKSQQLQESLQSFSVCFNRWHISSSFVQTTTLKHSRMLQLSIWYSKQLLLLPFSQQVQQ